MKILKNNKKILKQLETKKLRLEHIANCGYPLNPSLEKVHERRVQNAKTFLYELDEVFTLLDLDLNIKLVPRPTFEKQVKKADISSIELDGEYCKIAIIQNYPHDNFWLIYIAPINSI